MKIIIMILVVISLVFMSCSVSSPGSSDDGNVDVYNVSIIVTSGSTTMVEGTNNGVTLSTNKASDIAAGASFVWSTTNSGITINNPNSAMTTISGVTIGSYAVTVTASINGLSNGTDTIYIIVSAVTVTSVTIDQSNFTGLRIDAAIPTVTATVLYSDGSTDNDVTITYDGDTTSFNTFNMTATSNEDGSKSDSITVTVSDIVGSTWISGSKTITFDDDSNCTLDNNGTISASTYTLTGNNITTLFGYTINDDYTDESFTLNIDTYTLQ